MRCNPESLLNAIATLREHLVPSSLHQGLCWNEVGVIEEALSRAEDEAKLAVADLAVADAMIDDLRVDRVSPTGPVVVEYMNLNRVTGDSAWHHDETVPTVEDAMDYVGREIKRCGPGYLHRIWRGVLVWEQDGAVAGQKELEEGEGR